jgi:hypothetical protein
MTVRASVTEHRFQQAEENFERGSFALDRFLEVGRHGRQSWSLPHGRNRNEEAGRDLFSLPLFA